MYSFPINEIDPAYLADWIELNLIANDEPFCKDELISKISSFDINNLLNEEDLEEEEKEAFVESVWTELEKRLSLYGGDSPFVFEDLHIKLNENWKNKFEYLICLIFSVYGSENSSKGSAKLFEKICNEAIRKFFGWETIIFGSPREPDIKTKRIAFEKVTSLLKENLKKLPPQRNFKDGGVDIIAWKSFEEINRINKPIILFNCASGKNWESKIYEIDIHDWWDWVSLRDYTMRGFCIPIVISDDQLIKYSKTGIIIDRARIIRNIYKEENILLRKELKEWCEKRLKDFED